MPKIEYNKPVFGQPENTIVQHLYIENLISKLEKKGLEKKEAERLVFQKYLHEQRNFFALDMPESPK